MKRYFGLFSKRQMNDITIIRHGDVSPVLSNEPAIKADINDAINEVSGEQEVSVVEHNEDKLVSEVNEAPTEEVVKPKRRRRSKKASDSPSDVQEAGET